jgi:hypothetical protein
MSRQFEGIAIKWNVCLRAKVSFAAIVDNRSKALSYFREGEIRESSAANKASGQDGAEFRG